MAAPGPYGGGPVLPPPCANHPQLAAMTHCTHCGGAFCASCIVECMGQPHCGPCRERRQQWTQPQKKPMPYAQYREALLVVVVLVGGVGTVFLHQFITTGYFLSALIGVGVVLVLLLIGVAVLHNRALQENKD